MANSNMHDISAQIAAILTWNLYVKVSLQFADRCNKSPQKLQAMLHDKIASAKLALTN